MTRHGTLAALAASVVFCGGAAAPAAAMSPVDLVNPLAGTSAGGNTSPAAAVPFGMVATGPDTGYTTGYRYEDDSIRGFSLTHLSGPGCSTHGDVLVTPTTGAVDATDPAAYASKFRHATEHASPGAYGVTLDRYGVRSELGATTHTATMRFTFPRKSEANVLISLAKGLPSPVYDGHIRLAGHHAVQGRLTSGGFCGSGNRYTIYFRAEFDRPFRASGTWKDGAVSAQREASGPHAGAWLRFDTSHERVVEAHIGISYVSVAGARRNLAAEAGPLHHVRAAARAAWNRRLDAVRVSGGPVQRRATLYTALYHALLHPNVFSDVDGHYRGFDGRVHTARDRAQLANFSLWDTYRTQQPLLDLVAPDMARNVVESLLAIRREGGWLPKWAVNNDDANVMTGDPVTPVLADAVTKGIVGGDTAAEAYGAAREYATSVPPADTPFAGRAAALDYARLGYVPNRPGAASKPGSNDYSVGASATLEYARADCGVSLMADTLGHADDAALFGRRSHDYRNLWDPQTGVFRPRMDDGTFLTPFDPTGKVGPDGYDEDGALQYLWLPSQDYGDLVTLLGGRAAAEDRLDALFAYDQLAEDPATTARTVWNHDAQSFGGAHYNPDNEDDVEAPYAYLWTGRPDKAQLVVRAAESLFSTAPDGIPGNDDLGAMSAWYVLSALGLYPLDPGAQPYLVGTPLFDRVEIHAGHDRSIVVKAPGAATAPYVRSATLDGRPLDHAWVRYADLRRGARIDLTVGDTPAGWASAPDQAPPSPCAAG